MTSSRPPVRDREQARELVADSLRDWVAGVVGGFDTGTIQEQADRIVDALLPQPDPEDSQRDLELCIAQGGHFWPASELSEDAPDDEPPTCTRCGYNPGWKPGSVDAKAPLGQPDPEVEALRDELHCANVNWESAEADAERLRNLVDGLNAAVQLIGNGHERECRRAERAEESLREVTEAARGVLEMLDGPGNALYAVPIQALRTVLSSPREADGA